MGFLHSILDDRLPLQGPFPFAPDIFWPLVIGCVLAAFVASCVALFLLPAPHKALTAAPPRDPAPAGRVPEPAWSVPAESREGFRAVVEGSPAGMLVLSRDGRILFANPASREFLGRGSADPVGALFPHAAEPGSAREFRFGEDRDGPRTAEIRMAEILWQGRAARLAHLRDVTAQRRAETALAESRRQLQQAQKMEAIGRLAGGIAHDFNNILTAINGFTSLSLAKLPPESAMRDELTEVAKAGERASQLTGQLLAFSRKQIPGTQSADLNRVVLDMGGMIRRIIGEGYRLTTRLDPELSRIRMDPGQLEQIILNLAVNARDAMPDGGEVTLETSRFTRDTGPEATLEGLRPGAYARLTVSDRGEGMTPEVLGRLSEPFFTTKERGKGTGLGLSMVYGIVKQGDGHVQVSSEPGKGSTFRIYFPLAPASSPP